ncbi:MAG: ATP-binding cassette domain-containing protein [Bacteroidota bacterium]
MSERILKALMQLFSIISEVDIVGVSTDRRKVVQLFLEQQLNRELVQEYLKVFDNFLESQSGKGEGTKKKKRTSVNSVKVLRICTQINEELAQKQKLVVLIRLIEFINSDENPSPQEIEFVTTVAETFNISQDEYNRCMSFIRNAASDIPESSKILIIDNKQSVNVAEVKHIYSENLTGQLRILNIQSVNMYALRYYGTGEPYLNGQIIHSDRIYIFTQGSSIRSKKVKPIYYSDIVARYLTELAKDKIIFSVKDVEYRFKAGNIGLHKVNLTEESGHMISIMGGSGAGKSTLLNVLNGIEKPSSGNVFINGTDIHHEKEKIEGVIGFVPQDDLLMNDLTVYQNLFYAAKLCFGNLSDDDISKRCLNLLENIGLYETKDLKVGSPLEKVISGGQRKRLNIALELIREPSVLFLDEPTSGLSSRDSENIMDLLKELTLKGKLIFVVIHQPSSDIFKMFDQLIILDVGGYVIYDGNPVDSLIYFKTLVKHVNPDESECVQCGNVNPEQVFNIIESKVVDEYGALTRTRKISPKLWNDFFLERSEHKKDESKKVKLKIPKSTFSIPNKLKQLKVFITRDVLSKLANAQYMTINLLEAPILAFILAWVVRYYNPDVSQAVYLFRENENMPVYMFMSIVVALFIGLTVSAEEIIKDQKILKREKFLHLSKGSYLFSKITIMFVLSAIQSITFILIGNWILEIQGMVLSYWIILFSTACMANMIGLNISSAFNSAVTIYILIPFILIPHLLLSGVMVKFDKLNPTIIVQNSVPFIGELMVTRWAYEAMAINQFKENKFEKHFYDYNKIKSNAAFKKDYWISQLKSKIDRCLNNINDPDKREQVIIDLNLIRNELSLGFLPFKNSDLLMGKSTIDSLNIEKFNQNIARKVKNSLEGLHKYYLREFNRVNDALDGKKRKIMNSSQDGQYSIPELKIKISKSLKNIDNPEHREEVEKDLALIYNEISSGPIPFDDINGLTVKLFTADVAKKAKVVLTKLQKHYNQQFKIFKDTYANDALTDLVTKKNELVRIIEVGGELVQQIDPIYLDPTRSGNIRAHFYAPRKKFFGKYFDTYWVNIIIIWLMSLLLTFTLYFNLFKKFIDSTGNLFSSIGKLLPSKFKSIKK